MLKKIYQKQGELFKSIDPALRTNYTCPYLPVPTEKYLLSRFKILICGKETNGWGEKEGIWKELINNPDEWETVRDKLVKLYDEKINQEWENLGSFWPLYYEVRELTEVNPSEKNIPFFTNVGVCAANVALLGYPSSILGFDGLMVEPLAENFKLLHDALAPNITICTVGYRYTNYITILERALGIKYSDFIFYEFKVINENTYTLWRIKQEELESGKFNIGMLQKGEQLIIIAPHTGRVLKVVRKAFGKFLQDVIVKFHLE